MPVHPNDLPRKRERMMALHDARSQMAKLNAQKRLQKAVNSRVIHTTDIDIKIGDQVLVSVKIPVAGAVHTAWST